jgi:DNA-directed RNA polymerase II subunit RPB2
MITGNKTMDVPRHILRTLFTDTKFPLIQHHVDSFNDMLDVGIPTFLRASNPWELELKDNRFVRVYIGGKDKFDIRYASPTEEDGAATLPHACRLNNQTYALSIIANIDVEYTFTDGSKELKTFPDVLIGQIPLMLRSRLCYLSALDGYPLGECKFELGGYFIITGAERALLTQELLGNNMFYAGVRKAKTTSSGGVKRLVEREEQVEAEYPGKTVFEEEDEWYAGIKTLSEDGTRGPYSHFLTLPSETTTSSVDPSNMKDNIDRDRRVAMIQLYGFQQPVPVISVFRALGCTSDRDIYETTLAGVSDKDRLAYDDIFYQLILSHDKYLESLTTPMTDLEILAYYTRNKSRFEVVQSLHDTLFSHIEGPLDDTGDLFRRKAYMLGHMLKMTIDVAIGRKAPSDRDNMQFKRMQTSGVLCFQEFQRIYREMGKEMLDTIDKKHTYEASTFRDKALVNLIEPDRIKRFWKYYRMLNGLEKSFKDTWGGEQGIAQILGRPSYAAVIHHLRKTDLQIDKSTSTAPPRRLYASQFGIMCPVDSPDGADIGYKKALTILARVSTAFPSDEVKKLLKDSVRPVADIHPSTWKPEWTRVYINSDLYAVCTTDTNKLHEMLLKARRSGILRYDVSLAWNMLNNEYKIYCDAGRPVRPVYRPGVTPEQVRAAKSWKDVANLLDYMDASESDSVRISMTPFSATRPSEIHMSFNMSALANLVPFPDHNPGPRNKFSIAQQKQAASWYHTNYMKRFDRIAMMAACPQKPLSQTWLYHEMMGAGGCLGYGENALVAITMYGGHNQEDSVIMNGGALKRGMHHTMYWHSYDHMEEFISTPSRDKETDTLFGPHTEISNPLKKESVRRREGMNYEKLDADGIIKIDSIVDENTILVGMLSPILGPNGQVVGYRDASVEPKRGQHGRVDAVYRYSTPEGLRGVKIRILEERTPVIGDKMASRHSQKGTVGMIMPEEDMPFTSKGIRPDLIFNPHGIPTRMTIGQFLEAASNKLGVHLGSFVDATPFTLSNRVGELRVALLNAGFEPYGSEVLYNGQTGEMMTADVFMGPIYYQRLKHMVEDKINYRNTGPKTLMTHQPTQGRSDEGGLRIGEMERDGLIAHGMSKFLTESMMERSDKTTVQFDREEGRLDTSRDMLDMPYSMALFTQELEAMHIEPRIISS